MRDVSFKASVATNLSGLGLPAKKLWDLVGREKTENEYHLKYTPQDLRTAHYRFAGVDEEEQHQRLHSLFEVNNHQIPKLIVTRMTKGGVGKTSCSVNIAVSMAMAGLKVLFIDADPQASATNMLGVDSNFQTDIVHIGTFLTKKPIGADHELPKSIIPIFSGGFLDLIPADITMSATDAQMVSLMASHERAMSFLSRNSRWLSQNYDVINVDSAPGTTPIGLAFTYAAKISGKILAIVEPEGTCLRALDSLESNINEINEFTHAGIGIEIVINKFHSQLKHIKECMGVLLTQYSTKLNENMIPQYSGFSRQMDPANRATGPLVLQDSNSVGAKAIFGLTKSLIKSFGITLPGIPPEKMIVEKST